MARFNSTTTRAANTATGPIKTKPIKRTTTHEGAAAHVRGNRGELFLLAVTNFVGQDTFYETAAVRDGRYQALVRKMAVKDPDWTAAFLGWLRGPEANMRTASLVGAAEFAKARLDAGEHGVSRQVISSVLQRADEPGEMLAYWTSNYGRTIPKPVKRGIGDAVTRLYNQRSLLKYDTDSKGYRFGDVIDLTHPTAGAAWQHDLFTHALDRRHNRGNPIPESLTILRGNDTFRQMSAAGINGAAERGELADVLAGAGVTWEQLSVYGAWTAARWEAVIPSMGYMALLRNLRNFDQAGVSDKVAATVAAKLSDPDEVARSRQFPFRFLSAYEAAPSLRWGHALDVALGHALKNLPDLPGRTLILIDTSGSMTDRVSGNSTMTRVKAAAVLGVALGVRLGGNADIYGFATGEFQHAVKKGASTITEIDRFVNQVGKVGHGTDIAGAVRRQYNGHDRVFILSDMQTQTGGITAPIPANVPVYGFNLGGYRPAAYALGPNRHEFGSLTDSTFRLVPLLERGTSAGWPWELDPAA